MPEKKWQQILIGETKEDSGDRVIIGAALLVMGAITGFTTGGSDPELGLAIARGAELVGITSILSQAGIHIKRESKKDTNKLLE